MKSWMKITAVFLSIALLTVFAACSGEDHQPTEAPTEAPVPQLHTVAPTEGLPVEWAPVDSELSLEDKTSVYAEKEDFEMFAVFGTTDEDGELRFILTDETAEMLRTEGGDSGYYLVLNGTNLGAATLSEDCSQVIFKDDYTYYELCLLATQIRGLN